MDLDLRLSAANVIVSNAKLGRTAIAANLRNGHLVLTVGEAQAYGGVIKGSMTFANFEQGVDIKSQLNFNDVDLETCLGQLFGLRRLEGKGNIALTIDGSGDSVLGVTQTLNGTAGPDRDKRRARGAECRAAASPPGAAAAVGWRRVPQRTHAL
jgi:AsmA protein